MKLISVSKYFTYLFLIILILGCNDGTSTYVHPPPSSSDFPYVFDEYPATGIVTEYDEYLIEQNEERWIFIKGKLLVEYNSYIIYVNDEHLGTGSLEELSYNNKNTGNFTKPIKIDASEYDGLVEPPNAKIDVTDYSGEDIYYTHDFTVRYIEPREMNVQYTYLKSHDESNNILTHDILEYLDTP
ncbi:MAG: hypothetical protein K9J16_17185, partial [Melioribacteraceae bacterium]|nr:hypothetical protein [Melioribacteraceae bacterium]MCF8356572.1 hypothetical protein [Melioribacteraceae bacterium]MCF8395932.1 hypothetical protein [Melioribacteraceae bacterium]MCF8420998.1 hypothetical protein [Melioribacteraceae bacterium]